MKFFCLCNEDFLASFLKKGKFQYIMYSSIHTHSRTHAHTHAHTHTHICICVCVCSGTQWCPTLCDPMDCSPPGSSAHGISQARLLECVAMPSRGSFQPRVKRASPALAGGFFTTSPLGKTLYVCVFVSLYTYICVCIDMKCVERPSV